MAKGYRKFEWAFAEYLTALGTDTDCDPEPYLSKVPSSWQDFARKRFALAKDSYARRASDTQPEGLTIDEMFKMPETAKTGSDVDRALATIFRGADKYLQDESSQDRGKRKRQN